MSATVAFDMTVEDVIDKIQYIKLLSIADEEASSYELADLMENILKAIADGTDNPYDLAYTFFQELDKEIEFDQQE